MKTKTNPLTTLILALFCFSTNHAIAQCIGEPITLANPSFEDFPGKGIAPNGWIACQSGQSPDIQPGSFGVNLAASDGNTFAGLYFLDTLIHPNIGTWQEGLSQLLANPLVAGNEYHSSIDLANSSTTDSQLEPGCAELEIWGGQSACDHQELLWHSGNISNFDVWANYPIVFTPSANYTSISIQIKGLGCSGMPYILVDNFTSLVPYYHVKVNAISSHDTVCKGNSVSLSATASNGSGSYFFSWSNTNLTTDFQTLTIDEETTISVIATDANGCESAPDTITINTWLPLSFKYYLPEICEGDTALIKLYARGGNGNYSYRLNNISFGGNSTRFKPSKDSIYIITLTDDCGSITDTIHMTINNLPKSDFSFSNINPTLVSFLDLSSINNGKITNWDWSFGDNGQSSDQFPLYTYLTAGNYPASLTVTSDKGCKSTSAIQVVKIQPKENGTGTTVQVEALNGISSGFENRLEKSTDCNIIVFNMSGIKMAEIKNEGMNIRTAINTISLPSGTYCYVAYKNSTIIEKGKIALIK